jgi:hypothetical protein
VCVVVGLEDDGITGGQRADVRAQFAIYARVEVPVLLADVAVFQVTTIVVFPETEEANPGAGRGWRRERDAQA